MIRESARPSSAIDVRDAATRRVRMTTAVAIAIAAALTGAFTALAAASTHAKKVVRRLESHRTATHRLPPVIAPAPPLVQLGGASAPPPSSSPAPTPLPATAPPVVASGGS